MQSRYAILVAPPTVPSWLTAQASGTLVPSAFRPEVRGCVEGAVAGRRPVEGGLRWHPMRTWL